MATSFILKKTMRSAKTPWLHKQRIHSCDRRSGRPSVVSQSTDARDPRSQPCQEIGCRFCAQGGKRVLKSSACRSASSQPEECAPFLLRSSTSFFRVAPQIGTFGGAGS